MGVRVGVGVGEEVGVGIGLATTFCCQISLPLLFLQTREPEVELILVHLAPNLAVAPWESAGRPRSRTSAITTEIPLRPMGLLSQMWIQKVKMSGSCFKVWE